jgi:hypothetical protein
VKHTSVKCALFAIILLATYGCGKSNSVTRIFSQPDPVEDLKRAMNSFAKQTSATNFAYDVSKTDSLVSPYVGTITYTYFAEPAQKPGDRLPDQDMTATFAYQEKKWVLKRLCEKLNYHNDPSTTDNDLARLYAGLHWCDDEENHGDVDNLQRDRNTWKTALVLSR